MGGYGIVLADDHAMVRQGLKKLIEGHGDLEVLGEAADGLELLELMNEIEPDMIILDIAMPNLRGIDAIAEIRKKLPGVKILVLSMHKEYLYRALSAGANGYLLKEDADQELFSSIDSIRQGLTFLSPRLTEKLVSERVFTAEPLSVREKEVLELIARGRSNKEVAEILSISVRTVESHRARLMAKLGLKSMADLVRYALQKGYI